MYLPINNKPLLMGGIFTDIVVDIINVGMTSMQIYAFLFS